MVKRSHDDPEDDDDDGMEEEDDGEDDDVDDDNDRRRRKKSKKKKKVRIMGESKQTDADRRLLRRKQRELHNDIALGGDAASASASGQIGGGEGGGDDDSLRRLRALNNELWQDVRYTREAVLDSENVDLIASKAARQAEKIVQVPRYDAVRLAQALVKKGTVRTGSSSQFNWRGLGFQVGVCFNSLPPNVSFLYGAIDAEYAPKERKKAERKKKVQEVEIDDEEDEQPEDVDQGKKKSGDGNELSAVQKHITVINNTLKEKSRESREEASKQLKDFERRLSQGGEDERSIAKKQKKFMKENTHVSAVEALFNPKSFTQTVENIFHFSFLVKESKGAIRVRSVKEAEEYGGVPGPVIAPHTNEEPKVPTQAIVSLSMKDWRDMCKAYEVKESFVPHRVDGKVAKAEKKSRKSNN